MLELVELPGFERRRPTQISGGQAQRVALARALINRPAVLLLDEPLGALDLKLRKQMQVELKRIQQEVGITFIYVTHDQEEAMTMSDRIAVMNNGRYEQLGDPESLYERPATRFVAGFLGSPKMNFIPATFVRSGSAGAVKFADGSALELPGHATLQERAVVFGIRPQHFSRDPGQLSGQAAKVKATVELLQPTGSRAFITFPLGGQAIMAELASHDVQGPGEVLDLYVDIGRSVLIDPETGRVL
jgi:multiple sugar transport system ATP-binding protein